MPLSARILGRANKEGPPPLDLLSAAAARPGDIAFLHTSRQTGNSVLACKPALTIQVDFTGTPQWIVHEDIALDSDDLDLQKPWTAEDHTPRDVLSIWQRMMDSVVLLEGFMLAPSSRQINGIPLVGWLGGISYEIAAFIESRVPRRSAPNAGDSSWPLLRWTLFDEYYVYDHRAEQWTLATLEWACPRSELAADRIDRMERFLSDAGEEPRGDAYFAEDKSSSSARVTESLHRGVYEKTVQQAKELIAAGDIYQANIAQCWTIETLDAPETIYRRLCGQSPAEFAAFFRFDDRAILSASPELFLQREGSALITRPIKGTRPRDKINHTRDAELKIDLLQSPKDQAELAMIVDLLRNDLGRICQFGSIRVTHPRELEAHPTVWHTTATITGTLDPTHFDGWAAILRALCPGGSITGAPKIRAMQIIQQLENHPRHFYCSNLGFIGPRGTGILNIAIRTIQMILSQHANTPHTAHIWAGGGIVADSDPAGEYEETLVKARALFAALQVPVPRPI